MNTASMISWDEPKPEESELEEFGVEEPQGEFVEDYDDPVPTPASAQVSDPKVLREAHGREAKAREIMQTVRRQFLLDVKFDMHESEPEYASGLWLCLTYAALTKAFEARVAEAVATEVSALSSESAQAVARIEVASKSAVARIDEAADRLENLSIKAAKSAHEADALLKSYTETLANALGGHTQTLLDQTRGCVSGLVLELKAPAPAKASAHAPAVAGDTLVQSIVKRLFGIAK